MTNKNNFSSPEVVEIESDLREISLCEALVKSTLCESIGESIRMIKQDTVKVNGEKIKRPFYLSVENFYDLQVGKKRFKRVKVIKRRSDALNLPDYRYHLSHEEIKIGDTVYFYRCCDFPEILSGEVVGFLDGKVEKGWVELEIKNKFGETIEEVDRESEDLYPSYENALFDLIKNLSNDLVKSGACKLEGIIGKDGDIKLYMDARPLGKPRPIIL